MQTYVQYINSQRLNRKDVNEARLHRFYRRVDFMEKVEDFKEQELNIDNQIIDTESNLWYIVLQKNYLMIINVILMHW